MLVPLAGIGVIDPDSDVIRVDFGSLKGRREELIADGVRLPRPEVSVNEDIEPRSILLNRGTFTATVGLPANNAVALIDYTSGTVEKIRGLEQADFSEESAQGSAIVTGRALWRSDRPEVSVSAGSAGPIVIAEHDVAAIHVVESTADDVVLDVVMGRGPARASGSFNEGSQADYFSPDFQHSVARIRISEATGEWTVEGEVPLLRSGGVPITGLPNLLASSTGLAFHDEVPFDVDGLELGLDPFGAWFTGVTRVGDEIWCSDARRPSVYRFASSGELIQRYVPAGSGAFGVGVGDELLPAVYAQRWGDFGGDYFGGFQGIAAAGSGEIAVLCGSPLDNPDTAFNGSAQQSRIVRLLLLDADSGVPTREYAVLLDSTNRRFTDLAWIDGQLFAIEEGSCRGARALVRFDL
ncbi:MAG: esterase-like activity of phytase family protein, partial [Planctomycetota bacterium]